MIRNLILVFVTGAVLFITGASLYSAENKAGDEEFYIRKIDQDTEEERSAPEPVPFHFLPKTDLGYVDWSKALKEGSIEPKQALYDNKPADEIGIIDLDVVFFVNTAMEDVNFSHKDHTEWLDCGACHPGLFQMRKGATPVTMKKIQQGDYCGHCHGMVAFPLHDCNRCHSYSRD